jgi:hypothetical protein
MNTTTLIAKSLIVGGLIAHAVLGQEGSDHRASGHQMAMMDHHHAAAVPVTYEDITRTASLLEAARKATAKYQDVRIAEGEGFKAIGPDVPGMGIHYVQARRNGFDIEHPDILLYEKSQTGPGGYALVGVSYLLKAEADDDGQPKNPPFPKSLASWHRHANLCVFPDRRVKANLNEGECTAQGGRFSALTEWMVHAWIWKDSPAGVFSPINPNVQ